MRREGGYLVGTDPLLGMTESSTFTCRHCCRVVFVKPLQHPDEFGDWCRKCMAMVCAQCSGKDCDPIEQKLERMEAEARYHARRSYEGG